MQAFYIASLVLLIVSVLAAGVYGTWRFDKTIGSAICPSCGSKLYQTRWGIACSRYKEGAVFRLPGPFTCDFILKKMTWRKLKL